VLLFWLHWLWQLSLQGGGCAFWSSIGSLILPPRSLSLHVHVVCNCLLPTSLFLTCSLPSFLAPSLARFLPSLHRLFTHCLPPPASLLNDLSLSLPFFSSRVLA
jgi:hypothetical protein